MQILVLAANDSTGIDNKLGFVAFELPEGQTPIIHWLYVKEEFRGRKFSNYLLEKASVSPSERFVYTFRTSYSRYYRKALYKPAVARRRNASTSNQTPKDQNGKIDPQNPQNA